MSRPLRGVPKVLNVSAGVAVVVILVPLNVASGLVCRGWPFGLAASDAVVHLSTSVTAMTHNRQVSQQDVPSADFPGGKLHIEPAPSQSRCISRLERSPSDWSPWWRPQAGGWAWGLGRADLSLPGRLVSLATSPQTTATSIMIAVANALARALSTDHAGRAKRYAPCALEIPPARNRLHHWQARLY